MIDEKVSERIIANLSKYLNVRSIYIDGVIYGYIDKTIDVRTLRTITRHYNVRSAFDVSKTMNENFKLVVF